MFVYVKNLITGTYDVGFFDPLGVWHYSGFSYTSAQLAAIKIRYLNGCSISDDDFVLLLLGFSEWRVKHG